MKKKERYTGSWPEAALNARKTVVAVNKKWSNMKVRYGLTKDAYHKLLSKQKGLCAVCCCAVELFIDHCHKTGKVRGLICNKCNTAIGFFQDSALILKRAIAYLKK